MIKTAWENILEGSAVTLGAGAEDPACPLYRVHDRNMGRLFRASAPGTVIVRAVQPASAVRPADRLIIPAGHELAGATLTVRSSADDVTYTPVAGPFAAADGIITREWASVAHRYWEVEISSPLAPAGLAEVFLTSTLAWTHQPARPSGPHGLIPNVTRTPTASGAERYVLHGPPRRTRSYAVPRCAEAQRAGIEALEAGCEGARPFWLLDHDGAWIHGRLTHSPGLREVGPGAYAYEFEFTEVLP